MATIQQILLAIRTAIYGREIRGAIADGIETCYDNVSTAKTIADASAESANAAAERANTAAAGAEAYVEEYADLKSASDQIAETANQILYTNGSNYDTTYRTLTIKRSGYDVTIDGTSDATIKIKISGSLQTAISSSYPDSWSKTVPLLQGHRYRISTAILSGTVSENKPALYIVDSDNAKISSKSIDQTYEIDGNGKNVLFYVYVPSERGGTNLTFRVTVVDVTELYLIHEEIDTEKSVSLALATGKLYSYSSLAVGSAVPDGTSTSNGKYGTQDISFSAGGGEIELEIDSITASSTTGFAIADENSIVLSKYVTSDEFVLQENGKYKAVITVGSKSAKYLYFSVYKGSSPLSITMSKPDASNQRHVRWVSPTGSDDNDGTDSNHAFATINKAIADGGHTIMLGGGVYRQSIDLSLAVDNLRIISASRYTQPVICATNSLISESEEAVANTTKVYSCPCTKTFDDKNIWIFQDGVADAGTEITAEDRHPLQRGKPYRCPDTKIVRCSASTTEAAIAEIEAASGYKWFIDSTNHVLYFSRPQEITSSNPLCGSFGSSLFTGTQRALQFEMTGVGVKYQKINLMGLASPILTDCFVGNVRSEAGIQYDGSAGAKLYRCEAFRVFYSTTSGDGINAHSETTGDTFAKQTTCFQIDCWSHDNCDDGYSDHERCETTIIGGLYEFNGAGVTPAQGSHCTCYNVLSRYNGEADFFYTGNPSSAEGGVGGQIACYGCVAKGNGTSNTKGYRLNGSAVRGLFVGCVAIGEGTGFYGESSATGTLINCSTINCTTAKTSHYTAYSGSPVT